MRIYETCSGFERTVVLKLLLSQFRNDEELARIDLGTHRSGDAHGNAEAALVPFIVHRLAHPDGELATARAAGAAGTIMILSTLSNTRIEDVVAAASGPVWFQLYVYRDRRVTQGLVERRGFGRLLLEKILDPAGGAQAGSPEAGGAFLHEPGDGGTGSGRAAGGGGGPVAPVPPDPASLRRGKTCSKG